MRPLRITFLVDESDNVLRKRAEAFMVRLGTRFEARLLIKDRFKGGKAAKGLRTLKTLLRESAPDILYVVDIGLASLLASSCLRLLRRTRIVLDTGDLYGELHRESGLFGPLGIAARCIVEKLMLTQAAAIIVRGRLHERYLKSHGFQEVFWIPDGIDAPLSRPSHSADAKTRLGAQGFFTVGVMGSVIWNPKYGFCYGWELVEVMHLLRDLPVKGIFIGHGDGMDHVKARAEALGVLDRIVFTGRVPYEELPAYLLAVDVCISTQSNDWIGQVRTTAKLPEYLACGRYILATAVGEARFVLPKEMLVAYRGKKDPDYPSRLAERIRTLYHDPGRLDLGQKMKQEAAGAFDYDRLARKLRSILLARGRTLARG